jgi:hypothetical protein
MVVQHEGERRHPKNTNSVEALEWSGAWTLENYVLSLFQKKQTQSPEFKILLKLFGREKLEKIWNKHRRIKTEQTDGLQKQESSTL